MASKNPHDPGSSASLWTRWVRNPVSRHFWLAQGIALFVLFSYPGVVNASFSSFIANLLAPITKEISAASTLYNSQTVPLLAAQSSVDPKATGGGDITILDDSALLPEMGPEGSIADIYESAGNNGQISVYTVRKGDTLSKIAELYGVSANTIAWANDINRATAIREGQTLIILPISGVRHTTLKGDTVKSIAKKYKADAEEILSYNNLEEDATLAVGDVVIVPDGTIAPPPARSLANPYRGGNGPSYSGYYINPLPGSRKTQGIHGYNGVDLALTHNSPVAAAAAGAVIISRNSGWNGGYGNYVVVSHDNGTQTLYAHLNTTAVVAGQSVAQGQTIGYQGRTGKSTGSHLHFEVRGARNPF